MSNGSNHLFRKSSLEQLASPERLDQLMQAVSLRHWIPLAALGAMVGVGLVWSFVGRIPVVVQGRGAFVDPTIALGARSVVVDVLAPGSGPVADFIVSRGEKVAKGDLIGLIDQPELAQQLKNEKARLEDLKAREASLAPVKRQKTVLTRSSLETQRQELVAGLKNAEALTPILRTRTQETLLAERRALELRLANAERLVGQAKRERENRKLLRDKGLITLGAYAAAETDFNMATEQVATLRVSLLELSSREAEAQKAYLANLAEIASKRSQIKELALRARTGDLDEMSGTLATKNEVTELERRVAQLEVQLREATEVLAEADGTVLELTAIEGAIVQRGAVLGRMAIDGPEGRLHLASVGYLTIGDGMRVKPGMKIQVTPDTVKREEYGGIVGKVTRVSEFPITSAGAVNVVSNEEIARSLTEGGRTIELFAELETDPGTKSGYKWSSSRGPNLHVAVGTTNAVRVTVEERAPITFLLPFLKPWLGGGEP